MKGIQFDNAAQRKSYVGAVYEVGADALKQRALRDLPDALASLHRDGKLHIHDLEAHGQTYNCLQMDVLRRFPYARFARWSEPRKIAEVFEYFKDVIAKLGNEQSGGIGFPNFDEEVETLFDRLAITPNDANLGALSDSIESFIDWLNYARERCGQVTYYVSLNLGLATGPVARFCTREVLRYFRDAGTEIIKPNLIFKLKRGVNFLPTDPNHDLFCLALESTCRKMIPTYLLFDAAGNANLDPRTIGIVGCRTRVVADRFGDEGSIGRGNLAYVTVNLPRLALEVDAAHRGVSVAEKLAAFARGWEATAAACRDILLDRYNRLLGLEAGDFPANCQFGLWLEDFASGSTLEHVFRHGTLSIGFIGLSEATEILTGEKFHRSTEAHGVAVDIVRTLRATLNRYRADHQLNFTLLATSGEWVSGRFPAIDKAIFRHPALEKDFYTNSFHVEVDAELHPFEKLRLEGPFHPLANGGGITYVELASAPVGNAAAILDIIRAAVEHDVNYLGVNFPLDQCRACGAQGTFDSCSRCGGRDIHRIRRVSGYLEDLGFFTRGKTAEVARRHPSKT